LFDHGDRRSYLFPVREGEREHLLSEIRNEAGHSIRFRYRGCHLEDIIDSAGRLLEVETDRAGIAAN
jgi:hypothetical protein